MLASGVTALCTLQCMSPVPFQVPPIGIGPGQCGAWLFTCSGWAVSNGGERQRQPTLPSLAFANISSLPFDVLTGFTEWEPGAARTSKPTLPRALQHPVPGLVRGPQPQRLSPLPPSHPQARFLLFWVWLESIEETSPEVLESTTPNP